MLNTVKLERPLLEDLESQGRLLEPNATVPELPRAVYEARWRRLEAARAMNDVHTDEYASEARYAGFDSGLSAVGAALKSFLE